MGPISRPTRAAIFAASFAQAWVFAWGARALPSGSAPFAIAFALACAIVAALDGATALAAATGHVAFLRAAWRASSLASLAFFAGATWVIFTSAWYVDTLFRGLGPGIAIGLVAVWGLVFLVTVPMAAWGLVRTRSNGAPPGGRGAITTAIVLLLASGVAVAASAREARAARALPAPSAEGEDVVARLQRVVQRVGMRAPWQRSLGLVGPATCPTPPGGARWTLLVTHLTRAQQSVATCLSASSASDLEEAFTNLLRGRALALPMTIDLVTGVQPIEPSLSWLDALKLRPGLDGVCDGARCLAPWQLVARDRFMSASLGVDADARLGVDGAAVRADLGASGVGLAGLARIETQTFSVDASLSLVPIHRMRAPRSEPSAAPALSAAEAAARAYVVRSVGADGALRYQLDPFTGKSSDEPSPIARQAGVAMALCELGPTGRREDDESTIGAATRAIDALASRERGLGDGAVLTPSAEDITLTTVALPIVSLLSCRALVGERHDALIARLVRTLLSLEDGRGSFDGVRGPDGASRGHAKILYGEGQAVLALVMLERALAGGTAIGPLRDPAPIRAVVSRAMDYVAGAYWPAPLRAFFFVEENWHCLAAREAIPTHRNDGYERFCLDYVAFKSRLILEPSDLARHAPSDGDLSGGYEWGALSVPHAAATSGFGEALAAAIAVKHARGEPTAAERARLLRVLGFLVRAQWSSADCFACADPGAVLGGFSRHQASPVIRIDYVQHAWSALAHGARVLREGGD
ncbi:MAG: hypothetical protein U0235_10055 [Polyangiaceae bacterium]